MLKAIFSLFSWLSGLALLAATALILLISFDPSMAAVKLVVHAKEVQCFHSLPDAVKAVPGSKAVLCDYVSTRSIDEYIETLGVSKVDR